MTDWESVLNPRFIYFILAIIFLAAAVVSTCTGKTFSGYGGWAYRAKDPTNFWWAVAVLYLSCAICIGIYLHSAFAEAIFHPERWLQ